MEIATKPKFAGWIPEAKAKKQGLVPKEGVKGARLWTNPYCQHSSIYFRPEDLQPMTAEQQAAYAEECRLRRRESRQKLKTRRQELEREYDLQMQRREKEADIQKEANRIVNQKLSVAVREAEARAKAQAEELLSDQWSRYTEFCRRLTVDKIEAGRSAAGREPGRELVVDIETAGLEISEPLQLAIVDAASGEVIYSSHFRPVLMSDWEDAESVHHISPAQVKDSPYWLEELPKIATLLSGASTVIGWSGWHLGALRELGAINWDTKVVDVQYAGDYDWGYPLGHMTLMEATAKAEYDWGDDTYHDAVADCKAILHCWQSAGK